MLAWKDLNAIAFFLKGLELNEKTFFDSIAVEQYDKVIFYYSNEE